jgi:hypothetical protein
MFRVRTLWFWFENLKMNLCNILKISTLRFTFGLFQNVTFSYWDYSYWYLATKVGYLCFSNVKELLNLVFLEIYEG